MFVARVDRHGMTLADDCRAEVIDFHRFIEGWLSGRLEPTDANYDRARAVLAPEFETVSPSGRSRSRDGILADMEQAHAAFDRSFEIEIRDVSPRISFEDACLVTYEEWQRAGEETTGRLSTALFRRAEAPNGVEWLHLHETWLPDTESGLST